MTSDKVSRALHLGREQQTAPTDQGNELTPLWVEHGDFLPSAISAADWPVRSVYRTPSLPQGGPQVLGANLKCSESGLALPGHPKDNTPRYGRRLLPFGISVQLVSPCVSNAARSTEAAGPAMSGPAFQG
jgi:hypothetical protein